MRLPEWLAPNRLALIVDGLLALLVALAALLGELGAAEAAALVGSLVTFGLAVHKFLEGSQRWEAAVLAPAERLIRETEARRVLSAAAVSHTVPGSYPVPVFVPSDELPPPSATEATLAEVAHSTPADPYETPLPDAADEENLRLTGELGEPD